MKYAKIKNGQVVDVADKLPINTKITSNFYLLPEEERKLQGWYDVKNIKTISNNWQTLSNFECTYDSQTDEVVDSTIVNTISLEEFKAFKIEAIKNNTKTYVLSFYPDYVQINILRGKYDKEFTDKADAFIDSHTDGARALIQQVQECATYEEVDVIENIYKEV